MASKLFVSYSHADTKFAKLIVDLLRVNAELEYVFYDKDTLKPGQKWAKEITKALNEVQKVLVIWCEHALASSYVKREYMLASKQDKELIPVLLDDTPLPKRLSLFQGIDCREAVKGSHELLNADLRRLPESRLKRPNFYTDSHNGKGGREFPEENWWDLRQEEIRNKNHNIFTENAKNVAKLLNQELQKRLNQTT
ncbi:TIR domain-containing protein [Spirosoma sp. HMF4905]|uniref:TIR domain-containing protein n=1 Tax=Spirosoma arboris TaxID=2682092 RepID=A0A7K1SBP1_9BACT|nr:toll/interleukin-1 receptor domain-containing protein [Spirosoma arboris]MVM31185.1 TIR domain-containing protein [Spirosoma arboris]